MTTNNSVLINSPVFNGNPGVAAEINRSSECSQVRNRMWLIILIVIFAGLMAYGFTLEASYIMFSVLLSGMVVVFFYDQNPCLVDGKTRPDFSRVLDHIAQLGREVFGLEPEQLAKLDGNESLSRAEGILVDQAMAYLRLERLSQVALKALENTVIGEPEGGLIAQAIRDRVEQGRRRFSGLYDRLLASGITYKRDAGWSYYFGVAEKRLEAVK